MRIGQTFINDNPKPGRNDPCHCGSGKKYKKCCLPAEQRKERKVMDESKGKPTAEQAVAWLTRYANQAALNVNATAQCYFDALTCARELPNSPEKEQIVAHFERKLNEYVGDSANNDVKATRTLIKLVGMHKDLLPKPAAPKLAGKEQQEVKEQEPLADPIGSVPAADPVAQADESLAEAAKNDDEALNDADIKEIIDDDISLDDDSELDKENTGNVAENLENDMKI